VYEPKEDNKTRIDALFQRAVLVKCRLFVSKREVRSISDEARVGKTAEKINQKVFKSNIVIILSSSSNDMTSAQGPNKG